MANRDVNFGGSGGLERGQRMGTDAEPLLVGIVEAGATLGISRTAVYAMVKENRFPVPVLRVGDRYRVSRRALEDFIARAE